MPKISIIIPIQACDLFLYTSKTDGIPNIILEMASLSVSIVSSKICGITEILGEDYPCLVEKNSECRR